MPSFKDIFRGGQHDKPAGQPDASRRVDVSSPAVISTPQEFGKAYKSQGFSDPAKLRFEDYEGTLEDGSKGTGYRTLVKASSGQKTLDLVIDYGVFAVGGDQADQRFVAAVAMADQIPGVYTQFPSPDSPTGIMGRMDRLKKADELLARGVTPLQPKI